MLRGNRWIAPAICGALLLMWGCGSQGKVGQGRVIAFDRASRTLTLIEDSSAAPGNPRYDLLPPKPLVLPADPRSMGPAPAAGKLLRIDLPGHELLVFDERTQSLATIRFQLIRQEENVYRNDPQVAGKHFPQIDRQSKTITLYSPQRRVLVTLSVPEEYFALPDDTWIVGDEVRYYYKVEGQALRIMNVTQTDIG